MSVSRRKFLTTSIAAAGATVLAGTTPAEEPKATSEAAVNFSRQRGVIPGKDLQEKPGMPSFPAASFRIAFGVKDVAPRSWQGKVAASQFQELRVEPDRFGMTPGKSGILHDQEGPAETIPPFDYLQSETSWTCWTRQAPSGLDADEWVNRSREKPKTILRAPSLLLHVFSELDHSARVVTDSGAFEFVPADVRLFHPLDVLGGAVRIERVPPAVPPAPERLAQQDFPSLVATASAGVWVAWQEFDGVSDSVCAASMTADGWGPVFVLVEGADVFHTAVAEDKTGRVWVVWSMQTDHQWHLYGRAWDHKQWSPIEKLTDDAGPHCYHRAVTDTKGRLWLVWQKSIQGRSQIVAKSFDGARWSAERQLSEGPSGAGNNWWPAIAAGPNGSVAVTWDGYAAGNYDVYLRLFRGEQWGEVQPVANTHRFEAHSTVAIDGKDRVWVAWDESGPEWGKDVGFLVSRPGTRLHESRQVKIVCLDGARRLTTAGDLKEVLCEGVYGEFYELPHLQISGDGSPWLFLRRLLKRAPDTPRHAPLYGAMWELYAVRYNGSRWEGPIFLPHSSGRNEMMPATTVDAGGKLWAAWITDHRSPQVWPAVQLQLQLASLSDIRQAESPVLLADSVKSEPSAIIHPHEAEHVRRIRSYRLHHGAKTYMIYRGDLHRHSDISCDGSNDGSLLDAYRYARDAAALDFLAVTDHTEHVEDPYAWRRTKKLADLFQLPGAFATFYAYERSVNYPNGHRNICYTRNDGRVTPIGAYEQSGWEGSQRLFAYLRQAKGLAISHATGRWSGTDWRDGDQRVEPVVEIFQGMRDTYEYVGAPKPRRLETTFLDMSQPLPRAASYPGMPSFRPLGFVSNALALGYKLGFIASSDHISCHISYACVIAEQLDSTSLLEAIQARRTYAATDNIVLDVRYIGSDGEHLMGEEFHSAKPVRIQATVLGTGTIQRIDVFKNGILTHTVRPNCPESQIEFTDDAAKPGTSYYYVRVIQEDGEMAWGSPVWVVYKD